mgnify:CR=1 FL=1
MNLTDQVIAPAQGTTWQLGGTITCKVTGAQTADAFSLLLISLEAGQGAPWHIHQREDEVFYILEGTCTFGLGEETITAEVGTTVILRKGVAHFFRNDGPAPMKALITAIPGGLDRYFEEVTGTLAAGNPQALAQINHQYGITFL